MIKQITTILLGALISLNAENAEAAHFSKKATYNVCFTPGNTCQQSILHELTAAQESIRIQAYQLEDPQILAALINAKHRNLDVRVIVDKSQVDDHKDKTSVAHYLLSNRIPVWVDEKPSIAHNKVILIDDDVVITGSYNFSEHALKNAENEIKITDRSLYRLYLKNFDNRLKESKKL